MFNMIKTVALSALVGLGTLAAIPAHADSLYLGFGNNQDQASVPAETTAPLPATKG